MNLQEIEHSRMIMRYEHVRVPRPRELRKLIDSMSRFGQTTPVMVTAEGMQYVLIDGYLRLQAARSLGWDTLRAEVKDDEAEALVGLLGQTQKRQWQSVEQAFLIRDLITRFEWSLREVGKRLGRDPSWVGRRICLVNDLPEEVLKAVVQGRVSIWAASRVLAPLARANMDHAKALTAHLMEESLSTRELTTFLGHYETSTAEVRERMIKAPGLFVRAYEDDILVEKARKLAKGPEGAWIKDARVVCSILKRLNRNAGVVLFAGSKIRERCRFAVKTAQRLFTELENTIWEACDETESTNHYPEHGRVRGEHQVHLPDLEDLTQFRAGSFEKQESDRPGKPACGTSGQDPGPVSENRGQCGPGA